MKYKNENIELDIALNSAGNNSKLNAVYKISDTPEIV